MKEQSKIPTNKVERAAKFLGTGAKVGGNYLKHYTKKVFNPSLERDELDKTNAEDIFESFSQLKGSALKIAQMLSMHQGMIPEAYRDKFAESQHKAPPLSYPLIVKTFRQYQGKSPTEIFDTFSASAINAASIGQVHLASLDGKKLAVKIQYPGVAESLKSDIAMIRPFASSIARMSKEEIDYYLGEVEAKLMEETDYRLELSNATKISQICNDLEHIHFAHYYPEWSSERILVMDWMEGQTLTDFIQSNPSQELRDKVGQVIWDFYHYQIHKHKITHADPHPGNFLITQQGEVCVLDFGCVKEIPEDFYKPYFRAVAPGILESKEESMKTLQDIGLIRPDDEEWERDFVLETFRSVALKIRKPFEQETYDFGNTSMFDEVYDTVIDFKKNRKLWRMDAARGSKHSIYLNRTYFGLYTIMAELKANVQTWRYFTVDDIL